MKKLMKRKEEKISRFLYKGESMGNNGEKERGYLERRSNCMAETRNLEEKLHCTINPGIRNVLHYRNVQKPSSDVTALRTKLSHFGTKDQKKLVPTMEKISDRIRNLVISVRNAGGDEEGIRNKTRNINKRIALKGMNIDKEFLLGVIEELDELEK